MFRPFLGPAPGADADADADADAEDMLRRRRLRRRRPRRPSNHRRLLRASFALSFVLSVAEAASSVVAASFVVLPPASSLRRTALPPTTRATKSDDGGGDRGDRDSESCPKSSSSSSSTSSKGTKKKKKKRRQRGRRGSSVATTTTTTTTGRRKRVPWSERYEELRRYRAVHGHSDVPRGRRSDGADGEGPDGSDSDDAALGSWVATQRSERRKLLTSKPTSMTPQRTKLLDDLDFVWEKQKEVWEKNFRHLERFREGHGHCDVPLATSSSTLGSWVSVQRTERRKLAQGLPSRMTRERLDRLDSIGFVWDSRDRAYRRKLDELKEYRRRNGHVDVSSNDGELFLWLKRRKVQYERWRRGESTSDGPERRAELESVGAFRRPDAFRGENETSGNDERKPKRRRKPREDGSEFRRPTWEERWESLRQYRERHGHCDVPFSHGSLGKWVSVQRQKHPSKHSRLGSLSDERVTKLDDLGFVWDVYERRWNDMYDELKSFRNVHGHVDVPSNHGRLGDWVGNQRYQKKLLSDGKKNTDGRRTTSSSSLTPRRERLLTDLKFDWKGRARNATRGRRRKEQR